jgi:hypothetical protein
MDASQINPPPPSPAIFRDALFGKGKKSKISHKNAVNPENRR